MAPRMTRRRKVAGHDDEDEDGDPPRLRTGTNTNGIGSIRPSSQNVKSSASTNPRPRAITSGTPSTSSQKSKTRAEGSAKTPPKPNGLPIYSFFNAATQKQKAPQSTVDPEKLPLLHEEVELIQDDSDEAKPTQASAKTTLSQGSSTALAMRKRKFQRTQSFEDPVAMPPAASQKFRKVTGGVKASSTSFKTEDARPWTDRFAPIDLSELAVHKRKVTDVREWLQVALHGRRQKVLVLKGAAGTGKTTTLQLLAKDLGIDLIEWRDSSASDFASDEYTSATARFEEFVHRAGKVAGLTLSSGINNRAVVPENVDDEQSPGLSRPQALVVEEFPNTFSRTSSALQSFRSTIARYVSTIVPSGSFPIPMIMIISETLLSTNTAAADSFTAHRLLGPELISNPYINMIEFNAVAPTFLTKALELIVIKEARKSGRRRTPGPQVLKHLADTGDIRSAVSSLEFLCLRGDEDNTWSSKVTFTKSKQMKSLPPLTKAEEEALKLITNRESSLGIFHSVGKVVYNKRIDRQHQTGVVVPPTWLLHHQREKIPETDADSLLDELGTDTSTFISALHENYALSCSTSSAEKSLESLVGCLDNLSDSDLLSLDRFSFGTRGFSGSATDTLRQDEMCFQVTVRGMLFSLPHPVHRSAAVSSGNRADAHRMFYPAALKLWKKKAEVEGNLELLINSLADVSVTGQSNQDRGAATQSGVESWKRSKASPGAADKAGEAEITTQSSAEIRNEMLVDRLPYMAQILYPRITNRKTQLLYDQIMSVTRIVGTTGVGDDDVEAEDGEEADIVTESWSTDRPDNEASHMPKRPVVSKKQKPVFEALSIPVETQVDKLVLEDDDIVDD